MITDNVGRAIKCHYLIQLVGVLMNISLMKNILCNRTFKVMHTREQFHFQKFYLRTDVQKMQHDHGSSYARDPPSFPLLVNSKKQLRVTTLQVYSPKIYSWYFVKGKGLKFYIAWSVVSVYMHWKGVVGRSV